MALYSVADVNHSSATFLTQFVSINMKVLIATLLFLISSLAMAGGMFNAPNPYDPKSSSSPDQVYRQEQYERERRERDYNERRESNDRERREHGDSRQGRYR